MDVEIFNKMKPDLDRVSGVFLSTIDYIYRRFYLRTPSGSARLKVGCKIRNYFSKRLKTVFGKERVRTGASTHGDHFTRRIIGEMSLAYRCYGYKYLDQFKDKLMVCFRFSCFAMFSKELMQTEDLIPFRLPTVTLYFSAEPPNYYMRGAILTHDLNFDADDKLFQPWYQPFSRFFPCTRGYFWVEDQFVSAVKEDATTVVTFGPVSKIYFPTFQLFCMAVNTLMHGILDVDTSAE